MNESELLVFRRQIGFVFQEGALFDSMTVADNVAYRLNEERRGRGTRSMRGFAKCCALSRWKIRHRQVARRSFRRHAPPRVDRSRAGEPSRPIVLYDSPTAGLDPITSQTIITLILRLRDYRAWHLAAGHASACRTRSVWRITALTLRKAAWYQSSGGRGRGCNGRTERPASDEFSGAARRPGVLRGKPASVLDSSDAYLKQIFGM